MTPRQCRAARALLDWSQFDLAAHSSVSRPTIRNFECGVYRSTVWNRQKIVEAFDEAGVALIEREGVQFKEETGEP